MQLVFEQASPPPPQGGGGFGTGGDFGGPGAPPKAGPGGNGNGGRPSKRFNALGILEDIPPEELDGSSDGDGARRLPARRK